MSDTCYYSACNLLEFRQDFRPPAGGQHTLNP